MGNAYKFRLDNTYQYASGQQLALSRLRRFPENSLKPWLRIKPDGLIVISEGYCWDGCSPKLHVLDLFSVGTPDGIIDANTGKPKTYYASLVHDVLYQYLDTPNFPFSRHQCDLIFYQLMSEAGFKPARLYYYAVRTFGGVRMILERWLQSTEVSNG